MGISEVVYNEGYLVDEQTAAILAANGVRLRQFSPPRNGLVDLSLSPSQEELSLSDLQQEAIDLGDIRDVLNDQDFV